MNALKHIKFDCKHFRTAVPCKYNKLDDSECPECLHYQSISMKILIIKLGAMGDVIRSTPLVQKYRALYPDSEISWLTMFPDVLPKEKIDKIYKMDGVSLYALAHKKFDIVINLDKDEEACILLSNINAKKKFGFTWENEHIAPATIHAEHKLITGFFDEPSKNNKKHYIQEIFEICDLKFNNEPCLLNLNKDLAKKWRKNITVKAKKKTIVGLNTGCGERWKTRLWDEKNWIELIKLLKKNDFFPVLLGGEQENEKNLKLSNQTGCYYPGTYTLEEFFAISDACDIVVTQVSMMMHIAIALRKKIVLMNNIFNKHEFYLYDNGVIIEPTKKCVCYYGNTCVNGESCMKYIKPDKVYQCIKKLDKKDL